MVYIYLRFRVVDFDRWREAYDIHAAARQAGGAADAGRVLRDVADPQDVTVILGWSDLARARAFADSVSLKDAAQMAGVTHMTEVRYLQAA